MKQQVVIIHGADAYETREKYLDALKNFKVDDIGYFVKKGWKRNLQERLGNDFEVIAPTMPNDWNARYAEWKIWFEKLVPFLNDGVILAGHSMGGIFFAKYLSENDFPKKIKATFLAAPPFSTDTGGESLVDFVPLNDLKKLGEQGGHITFYQSKDDPIVLFKNIESYQKLLPEAKYVIFEDRGHFFGDEFPEIVEDIKKEAERRTA